MSILGLGTDVVDVAAFAAQLADPASTFVDGTFTAQEQRDAAGPTERARVWSLAGRFAAKEAFLKAWSASRFEQPPALTSVDYREMEVRRDAYGRPRLALHGRVAASVAELGPSRTHLSISHDGPVAVATVLLEATA